jgi:hypothetical protein
MNWVEREFLIVGVLFLGFMSGILVTNSRKYGGASNALSYIGLRILESVV